MSDVSTSFSYTLHYCYVHDLYWTDLSQHEGEGGLAGEALRDVRVVHPRPGRGQLLQVLQLVSLLPQLVLVPEQIRAGFLRDWLLITGRWGYKMGKLLVQNFAHVPSRQGKSVCANWL